MVVSQGCCFAGEGGAAGRILLLSLLSLLSRLAAQTADVPWWRPMLFSSSSSLVLFCEIAVLVGSLLLVFCAACQHFCRTMCIEARDRGGGEIYQSDER